MINCIRLRKALNLMALSVAFIAATGLPFIEYANGQAPANLVVAMSLPTEATHSQILLSRDRKLGADQQTFLITHGMGGTVSGDRFHQLAHEIHNAVPDANVLIIDWSKDACRTGRLGFSDPWSVAKNINPVAKEISTLLRALNIDPARTTFVGESFGNCVNARIAEHMGRRGRILAFNPPNAAGGYPVPDLRDCSDLSWSFQTYSICDTQDSISDVSLFLETPANASEKDQHVAGISWLADRVRSGELAWLLATHEIPGQKAKHFDGIATISGELRHQHLPRNRTPPARKLNRPSEPMLAASR